MMVVSRKSQKIEVMEDYILKNKGTILECGHPVDFKREWPSSQGFQGCLKLGRVKIQTTAWYIPKSFCGI